jgi:anti-sigma regulatory factor (Ser/Thr protein kinase)
MILARSPGLAPWVGTCAVWAWGSGAPIWLLDPHENPVDNGSGKGKGTHPLTSRDEPLVPDWPLISDLGPLGALPTVPRLARGFAAAVLNGWGLDDQVDVTELLVSELATNVVQASTASDGHPRYDEDGKLPLLWVRLLSDRSRLMVEVWDNLSQALGAPVVRHPEPDEESGRGLEMVNALSEDWGWESVPGWHGKRVWALLGPGPWP